MADLKQEALEYHEQGRHGKIEVISSKPCRTQKDLSLAYTPGVAEPCREIAKDPKNVYRYTAKENLVAVVTDGTAVLGLGNIGPLAGKPVMEGKGILFKRFADIDVFDIELDAKDPADIVRIVRALEPTFGGINLEDIKAPECFFIEEELKKTMEIPVFHDDQHGTAIISRRRAAQCGRAPGQDARHAQDRVLGGRRRRDLLRPALRPARRSRGKTSSLSTAWASSIRAGKEGMNNYKEPLR